MYLPTDQSSFACTVIPTKNHFNYPNHDLLKNLHSVLLTDPPQLTQPPTCRPSHVLLHHHTNWPSTNLLTDWLMFVTTYWTVYLPVHLLTDHLNSSNYPPVDWTICFCTIILTNPYSAYLLQVFCIQKSVLNVQCELTLLWFTGCYFTVQAIWITWFPINQYSYQPFHQQTPAYQPSYLLWAWPTYLPVGN